MPDERAIRSSLHEGIHSSLSVMLGWPLIEVSRTRGWCAVTRVDPRVDGDIRERGIECAIIHLGPLLAGAVGVQQDLAKVAELGEFISLNVAYQRALEMLATEECSELKWLVADRLMSQPIIKFDPPVRSPSELRRALERGRNLLAV